MQSPWPGTSNKLLDANLKNIYMFNSKSSKTIQMYIVCYEGAQTVIAA